MAKAPAAAAKDETKAGEPPAGGGEPAAGDPVAQGDSGEAAATGGEPAAEAKPAKADKKKAAAAADEDKDPELVRDSGGRTDAAAVDLLMDACERFGVNPEVDARPQELAAWRFYPGDRLEGRPDAVVIVTHGGVKLKHFADPNHPMDPDTEDKLRAIFKAFTINAMKEVIPTALPVSLVLPSAAVTGQVEQKGHVHRGGYLRRKKQ